MRTSVLNILAGILLIGLARAQDHGVITGAVLDERGSPVVSAKVFITEKGVVVMHRVLQFHETDADGRFRIAHVPWGTYVVTVGKEGAGCADTGLGLHCNSVYPTVVLTEDSPTADVTLRFGPKAGVLKLEPVTDLITGREIRLAAIRLKCADNPDFFIYTSAAQRSFLIPPLTDVLVEITAAGYKPWPPPDQAAEAKINLRPEEVRKLRVTLQPEPAEVTGEKK